jgi:hypothetical protein
MRFAVGLLALIVALAGSAAPRGAAAQPVAPPGEDEAITRYREGGRLLRIGRPAEALAELDRSAALHPSPNTDLLRAHALRALEREPEAMAVYERVVVEAGALVRAGEERFVPTVEDAGKWIALLKAQLASLDLVLEDAPQGAKLEVAGVSVAASLVDGALRAVVWQRPGAVVVTVRGPAGEVLSSRDATLEAGKVTRLRFDAKERHMRSKPGEESRGFPAPPPAAWVAGGIGATGLVLFAVFGGLAESAASELRECEPACDPKDRALRDVADDGKTYAVAANVSVAVGGAGLLTAVILWAAMPDYPEPSKTAVRISPAPSGMGMTVSF